MMIFINKGCLHIERSKFNCPPVLNQNCRFIHCCKTSPYFWVSNGFSPFPSLPRSPNDTFRYNKNPSRVKNLPLKKLWLDFFESGPFLDNIQSWIDRKVNFWQPMNDAKVPYPFDSELATWLAKLGPRFLVGWVPKISVIQFQPA